LKLKIQLFNKEKALINQGF